MAAPLRPLTLEGPLPGSERRKQRGASPEPRWLGAAPALTLAIFLLPVLLGLAGTWGPAFGFLPALGGTRTSLQPWRELIQAPGLGKAVGLALFTGWTSTLLALFLAMGVLAAWGDSRAFAIAHRLIAPMLAVPHAALAIGLAFVIAPSGWLFRVAASLSGGDRPPDILLVNDPWGLALVLGLVLKETPFLMLMALAAMGQTRVRDSLRAARSMGYGPVTAWGKVVLPQLYPLIRLPVFAVLAYGLSVVDMALILGPTTPPTLAVLVFDWFNDPDLRMRFMAAAGAVLQLGLVVVSIAGAWAAERLIFRSTAHILANGRRGGGRAFGRAIAGLSTAALALALLSLAALGLWSVADRWRYPDPLPAAFTPDHWARSLPGLGHPTLVTVTAGLGATAAALLLALGCLEHEHRAGIRPGRGAAWLLYLPLLVPQIAFLFGLQVFLSLTRLDGTWAALIWSHLLFVLPYVFLALADPWRALDPRYARIAACLGATPGRIFLRVKLPLMLRPICFAAAIGFSVSAAQYLPTLFAGAGRLPTLTTETVGLSTGADRRVVGVYAFVQMGLPLLMFVAALAGPALAFRNRRGMHP
jgi:putative thiamine transport system permease protein